MYGLLFEWPLKTGFTVQYKVHGRLTQNKSHISVVQEEFYDLLYIHKGVFELFSSCVCSKLIFQLPFLASFPPETERSDYNLRHNFTLMSSKMELSVSCFKLSVGLFTGK